MPDFILFALLTGLGVAAVCGPLGSFVVWRRMAYFGDTLAHSALLGAALGVLLQIQPVLAVLVSSVFIALTLSMMQSRSLLTNDTLLGIFSHSALALGLVCAGMMTHTRIDLWAILFGDLLTSQAQDVFTIWAIGFVTLAVLARFWPALILATLSEPLARAEGISTNKLNSLLMVIVAIVVALAMKVVGILLITALLIIPASASRYLSKSPEQMALLASFIGMVSVAMGLTASYYFDSPAGPSIVLSASALFMCIYLAQLRHTKL